MEDHLGALPLVGPTSLQKWTTTIFRGSPSVSGDTRMLPGPPPVRHASLAGGLAA